jgi:hypothetical protein
MEYLISILALPSSLFAVAYEATSDCRDFAASCILQLGGIAAAYAYITGVRVHLGLKQGEIDHNRRFQ